MGLPHQANSGIIIPAHWSNAIIDPISGASMEYMHLVKIPNHTIPWTTSFTNQLGRLAQVVGDIIKSTNTIYFIDYALIPKDRRSDITYGQITISEGAEQRQLISESGCAPATSITHSAEHGAPTSSQQRHNYTSSLVQRHH